ncbi:MAG: DsbC family protein [Gammaproteobacteria bacterium]|nr:DsbC family protein [Gammaproteobacteria bacterium]
MFQFLLSVPRRINLARYGALLGMWLVSSAALAQALPAAPEVPPEVLKRVAELEPGLGAASVRATPIAGLYEITLGPRVVYLTGDGRYLVQGELMDIKTKQNLTVGARRSARAASMDAIEEGSLVVFAPAEVKHSITVFTDVDCPYCSRFHREVPQLVNAGVKVRYAAFPRGGIPSKNYNRMVSVWCATDPQAAMTAAKEGQDVDAAQCPNDVEAHFRVARAMGVRGTPTVVLGNGELLPGYVPWKRLVRILNDG